ncbi:MAG: insulinase family protein [Verrucomicrobiota bacterium]
MTHFTPIITTLTTTLILSSGAIANEAQDNPVSFAHEVSDLAPDPAVTWGKLENGVRYAILPNAEPPDRVSLRLHVEAGSLMENEDQQGLAHFIEHMAFNGTTHFPAGEMVEYFQRLGMGFGSHTNAHVTFHETVYKLDLPNTEEAMLDEGFKLLRDYADGMLLLPDEIEDERGVILAEKRSRDSVSWRTFVEQVGFALPESIVSRRMPIGIEEVIVNAQRERFVEFYENWYTPNRLVVIAVGDIEVDAIETFVESYFADMEPRTRRPDPDLGELSERVWATHHHFEEEAGETSVSLEALTRQTSETAIDSAENRAIELRRNIAAQIINRRLERLAKREDTPISSSSTHAGDFFSLGLAQYASISADCKPGDWEAALALVEQELRRALEYGFTQAEIEEVRATYRNLYEESASQMATRKSRDLANQISRRIGHREVFTSPADDLKRALPELEAVTAEECLAVYKALWEEADETLIFVSGNAEISDAAVSIKAAFDDSQAVAVSAPEAKEIATFAYGDLPPSGTIAERNDFEDLEVTQVRFKNNVRANFKPTDFEDETVHVRVRIGSGQLTEPEGGLSIFAGQMLNGGGLEAHSEDELKQIFAGQTVSVGLSVGEDAFTLTGKTNPDDLEAQLQLMRAYITNPGFREEARTEFLRSLDYLYQQIERTPGGFSQDEVSAFLHGGDPRFGYPERDALESFTIDQVKDWVLPELESAYLEISFVGDFELEPTLEMAAATFGNLSDRDAKKPDYSEERQVTFPAGTERTFTFDSEIPKAMANAHWPTVDIFDIKTTRRLGLVGAILGDRLRIKVREELGDAYSPFAHNLPSDVWTDYGYLFASITVDPEQAESVTAVVNEIAADLATGTSITEDELERSKKPRVVQIEEMRRTNRYWLSSVLEASQEYPQRLDWARSFVDDYRSISLEEVNTLAAEYLDAEKQVTVIVKPE